MNLDSEILFVGQAPGSSRPGPPLGPESMSGRRLAKLSGRRRFFDEFGFVNLIEKFPGKGDPNHPKGDRWPRAEGRESAETMKISGQLDGKIVVMLGENVADAFGYGGLPWFTKVVIENEVGERARTFVVFPHPSGVSTWWNDGENVRRAKRFLRRLIKDVSTK